MTKSINSSYYRNLDDKLTKEELLFFKKELEDKREKVLADIESRLNELNAHVGGDPRDEVDHAFFASDNLRNNSILKEQYKTVNQINRSLNKIAIGTYGVCNQCEETIDIERLKITLFAEQCVSCKQMLEERR